MVGTATSTAQGSGSAAAAAVAHAVAREEERGESAGARECSTHLSFVCMFSIMLSIFCLSSSGRPSSCDGSMVPLVSPFPLLASARSATPSMHTLSPGYESPPWRIQSSLGASTRVWWSGSPLLSRTFNGRPALLKNFAMPPPPRSSKVCLWSETRAGFYREEFPKKAQNDWKIARKKIESPYSFYNAFSTEMGKALKAVGDLLDVSS